MHSRHVATSAALLGLALLTSVTALPASVDETASAASIPDVASSSKLGHGYINVTAGTVWTDSTKPRAVDAPAVASPVRLEERLHARA